MSHDIPDLIRWWNAPVTSVFLRMKKQIALAAIPRSIASTGAISDNAIGDEIVTAIQATGARLRLPFGRQDGMDV